MSIAFSTGVEIMSNGRIAAIVSACALLSLGGAGASAGEAGFPTKPIRLIVPFAPGGGTDLTARTIAQKLSERFGRPVVVDNRGGAGGVIGADMVAKATADGYTLLMGTPGPLTINPNLQSKMPYDTLKDFAPVSFATISPFVLVVHPGIAASTVKELIALAKQKPDALNYGSAGNGSVSHLAAEQFKALAGVEIVHVPYKGSSPALVDLLSGRLQVTFENLPVVIGHVRSGKLKGLAVGTRQRSALVPELPTMEEAGVKGYEASTAFGVLAPAGTPKPVVDRLSREIAAVLKSPDVRESLTARGLEPIGGTPGEYAEHLREDLQRIARIVKLANIRLE
jgi:tripartite-type tricarboxylate transporter receptor subunit TctC